MKGRTLREDVVVSATSGCYPGTNLRLHFEAPECQMNQRLGVWGSALGSAWLGSRRAAKERVFPGESVLAAPPSCVTGTGP